MLNFRSFEALEWNFEKRRRMRFIYFEVLMHL